MAVVRFALLHLRYSSRPVAYSAAENQGAASCRRPHSRTHFESLGLHFRAATTVLGDHTLEGQAADWWCLFNAIFQLKQSGITRNLFGRSLGAQRSGSFRKA